MKVPQRPPDISSTMLEIAKNADRLTTVFKQARPTVNGRYLHWDKLRHLSAPDGLASQEWWAAVAMGRSSLFRQVPLRSTSGIPFRVALPDEATELLHRIDRDAGTQILVSEDIVHPETRKRYVISSLMEEAITSSQVEGAATTRQVAKELLRTGRPPRDKSERMILNNYRAMQRIGELANSELTADVIFDLHRILGENSLDISDAQGRFRRPDEAMAVYDTDNEVLHDPPTAHELPDRLNTMCDFANGKTPGFFIHPVVRAMVLHFWLAYDHPFADGNGRCARALFYWSMLRSKYWLAEFISISSVIRKAPVRYGRAFLYVETDGFDLTYFVLYHLDVIEKAIAELQSHLKRKMQEVRSTEITLRARSDFNHRQIALLSHALRHPDAQYTISSHQTSHGVTNQTARVDLLSLENKALLIRTERGKTFVFHVPPNLAELLRK